MVKPDLGKKYICFKCGCKFYDLKKKEAICPKCEANQKNAPETEKNTLQFTYAKTQPKKKPKAPEVTDYEPVEAQKEFNEEEDEEKTVNADKLFDGDVEDFTDNEEEESSNQP